MSRAGTRIGLAALLIIAGSKATHNAIANGDTRTISFHHLHTGEDLTITYKRNGRYDDAALKKIDWLMRDWRQNQDIRMDPHLIDAVWEAHREVGSKSAIHVVCGYRAPVTNTMLRRRSSGVAQHSQHTVGKAIDFLIPDAKLDDLRAAGLRLQRGGVGFYPGSGWPFVHMDVGSVRHWPRMTHDQLAKVFPDGRTVHVPSDGQPLKGYALALADLERRGGTPSATSLEAARTAGVNTEKRNTFAALFGFGKKKDRDEDEEADIPARAPQAVASATPPAPAAKTGRQNIFAWNAGTEVRRAASANAGARAATRAGRRAGADAEGEARGARADRGRRLRLSRRAPRSREASIRSPGSPRSRRTTSSIRAAIGRACRKRRSKPRPRAASRPRRPIRRSPPSRRRPPVVTGSVGPWTKDMPGDVAIGFARRPNRRPSRARPAPRRSAPSPATPFRATRPPPPAPRSRSRPRRSARPKSRPPCRPPRFR